MRKTIFSILFVCGSTASASGLDEKLHTILDEEALTGIAWTLVDETGAAHPGAIGYRDAQLQIPFSRDTRFHVGSVTKSLLATGVLRMATQGLIELDVPVTTYLPGLSFNNPWLNESRVTVRHLLDHTAGLNDAHMWQMFSERPEPDTPLIAAFPDPDVQLRVRSQPGRRFSYSNMGYTLLGMIIESVSGDRYETYLDKNLLIPLGMSDSTFSFTTQEGDFADPTLAWGHVDDGSRYAANALFLRPAGQFTTTVDDLATFTRFLLSDGRIDGEEFIRETWMRSRGRPTTTEAAESGLIAGYALGLGRRDRHGVVGICHGGNIVGFIAMVCVFPNDKKAFAYSVNTDSETANYGRIDSALIRALGVASAHAPVSSEPQDVIRGWSGRYILSPNRFQTFEYLDTVFGAVKITSDGDLMQMTALQQDPRALNPVGSHIFSASDRTTASHVFLRGGEDEYLLSDGFRTYEKVSGSFLFAHWSSVVLGLAGLAWLWAAGVVSLARSRWAMLRRPEAPAFLAIMALMIPVPFFLTQSFMALGDFTLASALLAGVTFLLPPGLAISMIWALKTSKDSTINRIHAVAAIFALQWCVVLMSSNMLPLKLWA